MINSFKDQMTEDIYHGINSKEARRFPKHLYGSAQKRLTYIEYASSLNDLRVPPSNRLEVLKGDFKAYHSIRINDQWRIIFKFTNGQAEAVQIIDYH